MRSRCAVLGIAILLCPALSYSQQSLIGTYEGGWIYDAGYRQYRNSVIIKISSVDNGKVSGKLTLPAYSCNGEYSLEGTYQDNKLELRTGEGARFDCGKETLVLVVQGNKLVGKYASHDIEFSKE